MKRASLVVVVRSNSVHVAWTTYVSYTCQSVHMNFDGTVTFFCSGTPSTVLQADIIKIEYASEGAEYCPFCDQSIAQFSK